jgi:hypothetical protein
MRAATVRVSSKDIDFEPRSRANAAPMRRLLRDIFRDPGRTFAAIALAEAGDADAAAELLKRTAAPGS